MQMNDLVLFVEIYEKNYNFVVGNFNENQSFKIIEKITIDNIGITDNKIIDIEQSSQIIKDSIDKIEKKLNFVFKEVFLLIGNLKFSCVNISGYKKLNGSQILKENISYIINSIRSSR